MKDIDFNFAHYGKLQIYYINSIIENQILTTTPYNPVSGIQRLKREIVDTGILRNLPAMFSSVNVNATEIVYQF